MVDAKEGSAGAQGAARTSRRLLHEYWHEVCHGHVHVAACSSVRARSHLSLSLRRLPVSCRLPGCQVIHEEAVPGSGEGAVCVSCDINRSMPWLQHVANTHSEKQFACVTCNKRYAFAWQLEHHRQVCGKTWSCLSCDKSYSERLSLVVHCKRHAHALPPEARGWSDRKNRKKEDRTCPSAAARVPTLGRLILPKPAAAVVAAVPAASDSKPLAHQSCQTETHSRRRRTAQATQTDRKRRSASAQCPPMRSRAAETRRGRLGMESAETQTLESSLFVVSSSPLQTSGMHDYSFESRCSCSLLHCTLAAALTMKTVSTNVGPGLRTAVLASATEVSLSASRDDEDRDAARFMRDTLVAETSVQTDEYRSMLAQFSSIETQTCFDASHSFSGLFDSDDLFFELGVSDIETQTIWNTDGTTQTDGTLHELLREFDLVSDHSP